MARDTEQDREAGEPQWWQRRLCEIEAEAIRRVIREVGGDKREASRRLGVSLKAIYNKLNQMGDS